MPWVWGVVRSGTSVRLAGVVDRDYRAPSRRGESSVVVVVVLCLEEEDDARRRWAIGTNPTTGLFRSDDDDALT